MLKSKIYLALSILLLTSCGLQTSFYGGKGSVPTNKEFYSQPMEITEIPNWFRDDWKETMAPFTRSCKAYLNMNPDKKISTNYVKIDMKDMQRVCNKWKQGRYHERSSADIRRFFEKNFEAKKIYSKGKDTGTVTGYYEPYMNGSRFPTCDHLTPVYGLPFKKSHRDYSRAKIEKGILTDKAPVVYWVEDPVDFFIMQIQGSGVILDKERGQTRLAYAGNNNHKFAGVSGIMKESGVKLTDWSMQSVKKYLQSNPIKAKKIMSKNPRYIYYSEIKSSGPIGSMGVAITSQRSIAVDRAYYPMGLPIWIDFTSHNKKISKLTFAQDTGAAIKGSIRADYFWGTGDKAFQKAGSTHAQGNFYMLVPKG